MPTKFINQILMESFHDKPFFIFFLFFGWVVIELVILTALLDELIL